MSAAKSQRALYRIIDANANRLREALRNVEEYFRFADNDRNTSAALKFLRHEVTKGLEVFNARLLLSCRNSAHDVGITTTRSESVRATIEDVLWANLKRAQEAARVLEEYGKVENRKAAEKFKRVRFKLYELEKRVILKTK